jgi:hypothetical protein
MAMMEESVLETGFATSAILVPSDEKLGDERSNPGKVGSRVSVPVDQS